MDANKLGTYAGSNPLHALQPGVLRGVGDTTVLRGTGGSIHPAARTEAGIIKREGAWLTASD